MKKLLGLCLAAVLVCSFAACGNKEANVENQAAEAKKLSGINSEVTKKDSYKGTEYQFSGYMTTVVPEGTIAEDISINSDSTLFQFSDGTTTLFDVSFSDRFLSEAEVKAAVEDFASLSNASEVSPIKIDKIKFYGASVPDYGFTRYIGTVNGHDVTVTVYTDKDNPVLKKFIKTTEFVTE